MNHQKQSQNWTGGGATRSYRPEHHQHEQPEEAQVLQPYGVGIDTHSKFIQVCVLIRKPKKVDRHEHEFATSYTDLCAARDWTLNVLGRRASKADLRYCIESTGNYHTPVLLAWGAIPTVVNPTLAAPTRRKTDVLDARLLAHHSITGMWPESFVPSSEAQQLRVIWAQRREAVRLATRSANRINNILLRFGHTLGASGSVRTRRIEALVSSLLDGHVPKDAFINPSGLPEQVRPVISGLFAQLHEAQKAARDWEKAAHDFVSTRSWPRGDTTMKGKDLLDIFATVPGVGSVTALTYLAEVCDPSRFQNQKQVAAFAGCDPSLKTSAGKTTSFVRRAGNARLHHALLYAAAGLLRQKNEPLGVWGASIMGRHKKGGYRKACGAVARRIACSLWHVHRLGEAFSYDDYHFAQRRVVPEVQLALCLSAYATRALMGAGIHTTTQLADAYTRGTLARNDGVGEKTIAEAKAWLLKNSKPEHQPDLARAVALHASAETPTRVTKTKDEKKGALQGHAIKKAARLLGSEPYALWSPEEWHTKSTQFRESLKQKARQLQLDDADIESLQKFLNKHYPQPAS